DLDNKKLIINSEEFNKFYFLNFVKITEQIVYLINSEDYFLRCLLFHDLATSLRGHGRIKREENTSSNIFIVVEKLNWILKNHKTFAKESESKYVIDSLKNSLELN